MTVGVEKDLSWSAWAAYTPSWTSAGTQPAIGNGAIYGRYRRIGTTGHLNGLIQMGTGTTYGTGEWSVSLPSGWTARTLANGFQVGHVLMVPTAGSAMSGFCWCASAATALRLVTNAATPASITATSPASWTASASNWLSFNITVELAP